MKRPGAQRGVIGKYKEPLEDESLAHGLCLASVRMDKRSSPRASVECSVVFAGDTHIGEGRVLNVAIQGCLLDSPAKVQVGDRVQLRLTLPDKQPSVHIPEAVVCWVDGCRFGVQFLRTHEKDRTRLARFVEQHLNRGDQHIDWTEPIIWVG